MARYAGFTQITTSLILFLCCTFILAALLNINFHVKANDTHFSGMNCNQCHLTSTNQINANNAQLLIDRQEVLCAGCHSDAIKASHPSGMVPSFVTSSLFPLDWKGELTCSSCHEVHNSQAHYKRTLKTGKQYCLQCHDSAFFNHMLDKGDSLVHSYDEDNLPASVQVLLDTQSKKCLSCHQKQTREFLVGLNKNGVVNHNNSAMSHPIARDYKKASEYGGYHPLSRLDNNIHLPEGKLACTSCHLSYTSQHGQLLQTASGSSLCFKCHDL